MAGSNKKAGGIVQRSGERRKRRRGVAKRHKTVIL